jgi:hypothetical protein
MTIRVIETYEAHDPFFGKPHLDEDENPACVRVIVT